MRWRTSSTGGPDGHLAGILAGLDAMIWHADADERRLTYVSDGCRALSGRDAGAWLSAPDFGADFIDAADRERVVEALGRAAGSSERQELEYRLVAPDGGVVWVMNAFRGLTDGQGRRPVNGVIVDLTRRKEAELALLQQLSRSEEEYRSLFDVHPNPVWVYDLETLRFLAVNEATVRQYGWSRQELASMTIADIRPPEDVATMIAAVSNVSDGFTRSGPWHHQKRDGTVFAVEISSHTTTFGGRRAEVVMAVDVSDRRALEQQLLQAQKMEAVGQLAGGVAHDFNNLALVIAGHADLLLERPDHDERVRQSALEIRRAADQASALARQLLAFSRRQVLRPVEIDVGDVVGELVPMLSRLIGDNIALSTQLAPDLGTVRADPAQLRQVVMNLALNARDAMPGGGRLSIETSGRALDEQLAEARLELAAGQYVVLAVSDTGRGMDEATRERIFEPFFTTKEPGKGTGLGLSTVFGIVKQSGGSIWVYSELDRGTTFKVYLPRHSAGRPAEAEPQAEPDLTPASGTLLLVEDHEQVRTLVHLLLEKQGYTVLAAASGGEALAAAAAHDGTIELMITDLVMPGMDGKELAGRLRELRPDVRVLYTSGYAQGMVEGHELDDGDAFLPKPYDQPELAAAIAGVLGGALPSTSRVSQR
jgi:two-component system, cell cycle sensor histidine kinase and response regulator CckA